MSGPRPSGSAAAGRRTRVFRVRQEAEVSVK